MMGDQRRRDLESHVQETLALLKEYEDQLRLSDDPRERRRVEGEIAQLRHLLASYHAELAAPGQADEASRAQIEFVNRENELHLLHVERLRASRSPYTLISAPPGYGKTYLLQRLLHTVESDEKLRQGWCSRYVDCGAAAGDQVGHVVHAITGASLQHGNGPDVATDRVCDCVVQELSAPYPDGRRAVLLTFDAVERLEEATRAWLCTLLHELRQRTRPASQDIITVRVIVAGRNAELFWEGYEQAHPLPPAPQRINLSPFDEHPIQELIWGHTQAARIDLDDQAVIQIAGEVRYLGGGHPAVICGLVDDLAGQSFAVGPVSEYFERDRERLVRTVVSPVADELRESLAASLDARTREAVQTLSVFRRVNANTVQALVEAGVLLPEINEIDLLGDMQRAHLLSGPDLREPFYRDHLMRRIWALDMAHRSVESRAQYHRLNKIAIALYRNWIHNLGHGLPDTVLKATQRLLSVVEWLFHALQDEDVDEDELRAELQEHIRVLSEPSQPPSVADLIADEIKRDADVRYLLRRLGDDPVSIVCRWLKAGKDR
jgi:hypothetical protein